MTGSPDYKRAYEIQKKAREIAEQRLEDKSRELYVKNKSLEEALNKLAQQQQKIIAQEKQTSIGQLAAGLAHELNNPNAFIQNNTVTLSEYVTQLIDGIEACFINLTLLGSSLPNQQAQIAKSIEDIRKACDLEFIKEDISGLIDETLKGSKRISNIANSLRYFSNPDVSTQKPIDINECIHQSKRLISNQTIGDLKVQLKLGEVPSIAGSPILLTQAISNILTNALEAKPKSGTVFIESKLKDDHIYITIKDDGVGIPKDQLENIFRPFSTSDQTKKGLGLNIAESIVHQHQGHIFIKSKPAEGTIVTIELPLTKA